MFRGVCLDTRRKLSLHKTFRRRPERLLNFLFLFIISRAPRWVSLRNNADQLILRVMKEVVHEYP